MIHTNLVLEESITRPLTVRPYMSLKSSDLVNKGDEGGKKYREERNYLIGSYPFPINEKGAQW